MGCCQRVEQTPTEISQSSSIVRCLKSNETALKAAAFVIGMILVIASLACHFNHVNTIATITTGIAGGLIILSVAISSLVRLIPCSFPEKNVRLADKPLKAVINWEELIENGDIATLRCHVDKIKIPSVLNLKAAKGGQAEIVELFLTERAGDSCDPDENGFTILHHAISCEDEQKSLATINVILDKKPGLINTLSINGLTPLAQAALITTPHALKKIELLIAKGANVKEKNTFDNTPLHYHFNTSIEGITPNIDVIALLIQHGAKLDELNKGKMSAWDMMTLNHTKWFNQQEIQERLLKLTSDD